MLTLKSVIPSLVHSSVSVVITDFRRSVLSGPPRGPEVNDVRLVIGVHRVLELVSIFSALSDILAVG